MQMKYKEVKGAPLMKTIRYPNLPALILMGVLGLVPWVLPILKGPDPLMLAVCGGCSSLVLLAILVLVLRNRKRERLMQEQLRLYMDVLELPTEPDCRNTAVLLEQLGEGISANRARQDQHEKITARFLSDWSKRAAEILSELDASAKRTGVTLPVEERLLAQEGNTLRCLTEQLMRYFDCDEADSLRRTQPVELMRILSDAIIRRSEDLRARKIGLRRSATKLRVISDPVLLATVLDELLDNAIRHTPDNGTIGLICRESNGKAEIIVEDAGCGIPPDELPRVFERGFTGRGENPGRAGLGLFTARSYCELLGHRLSLRSAEHKGTQAILNLNLAPEEKEQKTAE